MCRVMNTIVEILYIGMGGFSGSVSRFFVSKMASGFYTAFPLGTLIVNITGSFLLGFIMYSILLGRDISPDLRNFMTVGFIGAYTTMSTFAYESIRLTDTRDWLIFALNVFLNVMMCLGAIMLGKELATIMSSTV